MNWLLLLYAYASLFLFGFIETARGPLYPEILAEWNLPKTTGAMFFTIASVAGLVINLLGKWWMPRFGSWGSLQIFSGLLTASCFGMGYLPSLGYGFYSLLFCAAFFGITVGGLGISVNLLVVQGSSPQRRSQAFGGLHACYGLASLLAPQILTSFFTLGVDWKASLQWLALGPLALFLGSVIHRPDSSHIPPSPKFSPDPRLRWYLSLMLAFYVGAEMALSSRLVLLLRSDFGYDPKGANTMLSFFFGLLMLGRLGLAFFKLHDSMERMIRLSIGSTLVCYILGLYVHEYFLILSGLTMSVFFPGTVAQITAQYPKRADEIIATVMTAIGSVMILVHILIGRLADQFGVSGALHLGPILLVISIFMLFFWPRIKFAEKDRSLY